MVEEPSPTVRHRRLSTEMKQLREAVGLGAIEVAERMGWDRTKVNRIERGQWKRLNPQDVRALADCYGASEQHREALVTMAKEAKIKGWWERYSDVLGSGTYIGLEAEASVLRSYEALLIPGLLQTPDYYEATLRGLGRASEHEVRRRVEARQTRQQRLEDAKGLQLHALVDEAALRKLVGGPGVMREQLNYLAAANNRNNIEIRVAPDSAGAHAAVAGAFVIIEFPFCDGPTAVFLENAHDNLYLEDKDDIERYSLIYDQVHKASLSPGESNELLRGLSDQLAV